MTIKNKKMTSTIKTVLLASLIAAMILPFSGMSYAVTEKSFEIKEKFKDEKEAKKYYKELEKEIKAYYKELKTSSNDVNIMERYQELKNNGLKLIALYSPDENVTSITEDEWFDYLTGLPTNPSVKNIEYDGEIPRIYLVGSGSVVAKIGYKHPCVWAPLFTCDDDIGSSKVVSTSNISGVDFIGYTKEKNNWITPYYKMSPASLYKTYTGITIFITTQPGQSPQNGVSNFNEYASYPGIEFRKNTNIVGSNCSCSSVLANTSIFMNIDLNNVT